MPKTKHWTQTPEGKRKQSLRMKRAWKAKKKANRKETNHGTSSPQVLYIFGRVEGFIEAFAEGSGISKRELTERVGELLLAKARREVLGA
jgi:hypothetical protein